MTMPAMAPGDRAVFPDDETALAGAVGMGELDEEDAERELEAEVVGVEEDCAAVDDDDGASVELGAALEIEIAPPMTCARFMTPTLLWQHALPPPQHQRSLSARPVQGVMAVMPKAERV